MKEQVTQVNNMNRKDLGKLKVNRMQLAVTYHRTLPSMSKNISKNWRILQIIPELQKVFQEKPITTIFLKLHHSYLFIDTG